MVAHKEGDSVGLPIVIVHLISVCIFNRGIQQMLDGTGVNSKGAIFEVMWIEVFTSLCRAGFILLVDDSALILHQPAFMRIW